MMIPLTPEQRTLYQARLTEAETALHDIMLGGSVRVFVDQNGERVEYTATSADRLRAYIMNLRVSLGLPSGIVGPMNMWVL